MENNTVHILFVCGMGMGTSTMAELGVKKNLVPLKISAQMQHTSLGMMESLRDWADIIVILKNLASRITPKEGEHIIPVVRRDNHESDYCILRLVKPPVSSLLQSRGGYNRAELLPSCRPQRSV